MKKACFALALAAVLLFLLPGCKRTVDLRLLEFPGTHWNDTPQAVMEALQITEEQILLNEAVTTESEGSTDEWSLVVSGLPCMGVNALQAQFRFIRCEDRGTDYGLAYVRVIYPEDTDMQAVKASLTERYGGDTQEVRPQYDLRDGTIEDSTGKNRGTLTINGETVVRDYPGDQVHNLYWLAGISGPDYFSRETQGNIVAFFTGREHDPIEEDAVLQWLELEPLSYIRWSDDANQVFRDDNPYLTANEVFFSGQQLVMLRQMFG